MLESSVKDNDNKPFCRVMTSLKKKLTNLHHFLNLPKKFFIKYENKEIVGEWEIILNWAISI